MGGWFAHEIKLERSHDCVGMFTLVGVSYTYNGVGALEDQVNVRVKVHNPPSNIIIRHLIAVINKNEEQVKPGHDGSAQLHVLLHTTRQQQYVSQQHVLTRD